MGQDTQMNLLRFVRQARSGEIEALELFSLEGGFYLLRVQSPHGLQYLVDKHGETVRLRSTTHLRDLLQEHDLPALPCVLVQHVVHDEMCGRRDGPIEPLRLPVNLERQW